MAVVTRSAARVANNSWAISGWYIFAAVLGLIAYLVLCGLVVADQHYLLPFRDYPGPPEPLPPTEPYVITDAACEGNDTLITNSTLLSKLEQFSLSFKRFRKAVSGVIAAETRWDAQNSYFFAMVGQVLIKQARNVSAAEFAKEVLYMAAIKVPGILLIISIQYFMIGIYLYGIARLWNTPLAEYTGGDLIIVLAQLPLLFSIAGLVIVRS
jgi:hypothetical protein